MAKKKAGKPTGEQKPDRLKLDPEEIAEWDAKLADKAAQAVREHGHRRVRAQARGHQIITGSGGGSQQPQEAKLTRAEVTAWRAKHAEHIRPEIAACDRGSLEGMAFFMRGGSGGDPSATTFSEGPEIQLTAVDFDRFAAEHADRVRPCIERHIHQTSVNAARAPFIAVANGPSEVPEDEDGGERE